MLDGKRFILKIKIDDKIIVLSLNEKYLDTVIDPGLTCNTMLMGDKWRLHGRNEVGLIDQMNQRMFSE